MSSGERVTCARCGAVRYADQEVCAECGYNLVHVPPTAIGRFVGWVAGLFIDDNEGRADAPDVTSSAPDYGADARVENRTEPDMVGPAGAPRCADGHCTGRRYCSQCGRLLLTPCAECGAETPIDGRYCVECGAATGRGTPQEDGQATSHSAARLPSVGALRPSLAGVGALARNPSVSSGWQWFQRLRAALDFAAPIPDPFPSRRSRLLAEVAAVAALTIIALVLRTWNIGSVPAGVGGDEASIALEALRILEGEWIGIWSGVALGNPAGHHHWIALFFWLLEPTVAALRLSTAFLGVAFIPMSYLLVRTLLPARIALITAALVAFSVWFVIQSRLGFPMMMSVFMAAASLYLLVFAIQSRRPWLAALAGLLLGVGLYSFKAYLIFYVAIWGAGALALLASSQLRKSPYVYLFLLASLLPAAPLLLFYATSDYLGTNLRSFYRVEDLLVFWPHLAESGKALTLVHGGLDYSNNIDAAPQDGLLNPVFWPFYWVGLASVLLFINRRSSQIVLLGLLIAASPAILVPGSESRRYLFGIFFVYLFVAIGFGALLHLLMTVLQEKWSELSEGFRRKLAPGLLGAAAFALILIFAGLNIAQFGDWRSSEEVDFQFPENPSRVANYLNSSSGDYNVRFYSANFPAHVETIAWLAPGISGSSGSVEFGGDGTIFSEGVVDEPTVFILMDHYLPLIDELKSVYPMGEEIVHEGDDGQVHFVSYAIQDPPAPGTVVAPQYYRLSPNPEQARWIEGIPSSFSLETNQDAPVHVVLNPPGSIGAPLASFEQGCPGQIGATVSVNTGDAISLVACEPGEGQIQLVADDGESMLQQYRVSAEALEAVSHGPESGGGLTYIDPDPSKLTVRADPAERHALELVTSQSVSIIPAPDVALVVHNNRDLVAGDVCADLNRSPEGDTRILIIVANPGEEIRSPFYIVGCSPGQATLRLESEGRILTTHTINVAGP